MLELQEASTLAAVFDTYVIGVAPSRILVPLYVSKRIQRSQSRTHTFPPALPCSTLTLFERFLLGPLLEALKNVVRSISLDKTARSNMGFYLELQMIKYLERRFMK